MVTKILSVEKVNCYLNKSNPPVIAVYAEGTVNSGGWSGGVLAAWSYNERPKDGIVDFDFLAVPPDGNVTWGLEVIKAQNSAIYQQWVKGVRVHTSQNTFEALLNEEQSLEMQAFSETDPPFPLSVPPGK